ncbi:FAD/NAD(P)-binding protein [Nonomuraea monospora]|uniref:FAD/NAD(P)-binding protein n=1 Tax=Nonomuraea monospora TaxID=568818 RepID=A0ABN3D2B1_9ACTN
MVLPSITIVGGGASGTLTAIHLLRLARATGTPVAVTLLDQGGRHALGQAYSTTDPHHLLNTRVERMSALDDDPDHLRAWARTEGVHAYDYLPRAVYGRYLREVLAAAEDPPARPLHRVTATAVALDADHTVRLSDGGRIGGDAVVLALGNRSPAPLPGVPAHPRYIADPWAPGALAAIDDGAPVLVLGTGLTMVDVALTVTRAHPDTVVHALSRHALLPRPHLPRPALPIPVAIPDGPLRVADLLSATRRAVRASGDWQGVMEGLRPHVQELWQRLGADERRLFLRRVARYWEIHRHRIPPSSASAIEDLRAAGRLRLLRGSLLSAEPAANGLRVHTHLDDAANGPRVHSGSGGATTGLDVGWLVNATGPGGDVTSDPFLATLIASGAARPDPLGLGLDADPDGALRGSRERLFAVGPLLRGSLYETTAVPEIRTQAAALAPRLLEIAASHAAPSQSVA